LLYGNGKDCKTHDLDNIDIIHRREYNDIHKNAGGLRPTDHMIMSGEYIDWRKHKNDKQ
jgi:hypothetical protein